jgi:hypothetical protein
MPKLYVNADGGELIDWPTHAGYWARAGGGVYVAGYLGAMVVRSAWSCGVDWKYQATSPELVGGWGECVIVSPIWPFKFNDLDGPGPECPECGLASQRFPWEKCPSCGQCDPTSGPPTARIEITKPLGKFQ